MIEVEAPDGTIVEFPDDMPTAEIERVMRQTFGGPDEGQQPQAQAEGDRGFLAFLNQGIATTLGAPVDAVNWGLKNTVGRVMPGAVSETPFLGSASIANMLRSGGVRVADVNQKAEGMLENIGSGLGGAAGGLVLGGGALAGLARSASPMAQAAAKTLGSPFLAAPKRALASEALAGAGSGLGIDIAQNVAPDNPYAETAGALLGGIAGGMGPMMIGRTAMNMPGVGVAARLAAREVAPFTEAGALERARSRVVTLVEDKDAALQALQEPTTAPLTPAQRSGDRRLMGLERTVRDVDPEADRMLRERETAAHQILREGIMAPAQGETAAAAREFASKRVSDLVNKMETRVSEAERTARERVAKLTPERSQAEASIIVREELENALSAARAEEKQLWSAIPQDVAVPVASARSRYEDIKANTPRAQQDDIPEAAKKFLDRESNSTFADQETARELHGLYSELRREARNSRAGDTPNRNRARLADELADALLEDMQSVSGVAEPLREALDFSRKLNETFGRGSVGKVLGSERTGGDRVADIETLGRTVGRSGPAGAVGFDEVAAALAESRGTPVANEAVQDYIRGRFSDQFVRDGELRGDPNRFRTSNRDVLERVPEVDREIAEALTSSEAAKRMREQAATMGKAVEKQSASGILANSREGDEIKTILRSRNPQALARETVKQARKDPTGAAVRGLKGALVDDLMDAARTGQFDETGRPLLSGRAIIQKLDDDQNFSRVAGEIMDPKELEATRKLAEELRKLELARNEAVSADRIMGDEPNSIIGMVARTFAARMGARAGQGTSGASLQTSSLAVRRINQLLASLTNDKAEALIREALTSDNTDLLETLLMDPRKVTPQRANRIVETLTGIIGSETGRPDGGSAEERRPLELTVTPGR